MVVELACPEPVKAVETTSFRFNKRIFMKKAFKISFAFILGFALIFAFSSCGEKKSQTVGFGYVGADFSVKVDVPNTDSAYMKKAQKMDKKMTAVELTEKMGNGINLGNTMEAYRGWDQNYGKEVSFYEQLWGQPITKAEMFKAYKDAGFDSVRIPVAWTNMIDYEHGNYELNPKLLDRIELLVNWAIQADLYVIINDHWDGQWWGMFGAINKDNRYQAGILYKSIWTQVANRFKNYDEHLIFESANEELGSRLNDETAISHGLKGNLSQFECYDCTNKINQCFVDLVRSTGSNNKYRFLLIAGYDTDIDKTCEVSFKMPTDSVKNRLLVSVHYYTPSTYCILDKDASWGKVKNSWGTQSDYDSMNANFAKMKKFVDEGYGVIIGEYGVAKNSNQTKKDGMEAWLTNVLDNCDEYNYCPMLWDCNTFFFKREPMGFRDEEIANVYKNRN